MNHARHKAQRHKDSDGRGTRVQDAGWGIAPPGNGPVGSEGRGVTEGVGDVETRDVQARALAEVPKQAHEQAEARARAQRAEARGSKGERGDAPQAGAQAQVGIAQVWNRQAQWASIQANWASIQAKYGAQAQRYVAWALAGRDKAEAQAEAQAGARAQARRGGAVAQVEAQGEVEATEGSRVWREGVN